MLFREFGALNRLYGTAYYEGAGSRSESNVGEEDERTGCSTDGQATERAGCMQSDRGRAGSLPPRGADGDLRSLRHIDRVTDRPQEQTCPETGSRT